MTRLTLYCAAACTAACLMAAASCSEGQAPDNEAVVILAKSVVDGDYVADSTRTIYVTYNRNVAIADSSGITLDSVRIAGAVTDNATLRLPVDLKPGREYSLRITDRAIKSQPGGRPAPGVTVGFATNPEPI